MNEIELAGTLTGIRVLELGSNIAGPLAAMILGDLGADVIKVEAPTTGDDTRMLPPIVDGESTVFRTFNRSKRSVVLDLSSELGCKAFTRLASTADVVIESLRPGVADKLGLGFSDVNVVNPKVIYCSVTAFGEGSIGRTLPGYDAIVQAFSGMMDATGAPDNEEPIRASPPVVDVSTGVWASLGIMTALMRRPMMETAQYIDACLLDSAFSLMGHQVNAYLRAGERPEKVGSGSAAFAPYQAYRAEDGWIFIAAGSDRLFGKLCDLVGTSDLEEDDRFRTAAARATHREELNAVLEPIFQRTSASSWLDRLASAGVPSCPVNDLATAIDAPVTLERSLLVDSGEEVGEVALRLPIDLGRTSPFRRPPRLGEHTGEVLKEAGFDDEEIRQLLASSK